MNCSFAHDDAAYLVGALTPPERRAYEDHLTNCPECTRTVQQIAGLPGLLSKVSVADVVGHTLELPDSVLPSLLASVRRERRRRVWTLAALGVAAGFLALVGGLAGRNTDTQPPPVATQLAPVGAIPIQASVQLAALPWGTGIDLSCTYPTGYGTSDQTYQLIAIDQAGAEQQVATWDIAPGGQAHVTATSTWTPSNIAALEIRTPSGTPVMHLTT
jgi:predicted anti-sigma-YlaC factor YlaD